MHPRTATVGQPRRARVVRAANRLPQEVAELTRVRLKRLTRSSRQLVSGTPEVPLWRHQQAADADASGRDALNAYAYLAFGLAEQFGRDEAVRLLRGLAEYPVSSALARHVHQGCSVTGVTVEGVRLYQPRTRITKDCTATASPSGHAFESPTFRTDANADERTRSHWVIVTLRNVLGTVRPFVPLHIRWSYAVGLSRAERWIESPRSAFVFAEHLAPGDRSHIILRGFDLWRELPCPRRVIHRVRFDLHFACDTSAPSPSAERESARLRLVA